MPRVVLPIANGFYRTDSLPISSQNAVNVFPVIEEAPSLSQETLRGCPGVRVVAGLQSQFPSASAAVCRPYACDTVEERFGISMNNFTWPLNQVSVNPSDTFPVDAGVYDIQAPATEAGIDSWTGAGSSEDYRVIEDNLFGVDPCIVPGFIFRSLNTNLTNYPFITGAALGSTRKFTAAFLVRGIDTPSDQFIAQGVLLRHRPQVRILGAGGSVLRTETLQHGVDLIGNIDGTILRLNTHAAWNEVAGQGSNGFANATVDASPDHVFDSSKDIKNFELITYTWELEDTFVSDPFLLNGVFPRWNARIAVNQTAQRRYIDRDGEEQSQTLTADREFVVLQNWTSAPVSFQLVTPQPDMIIGSGNMKISGVWFFPDAVNIAELWLAIKQNRVGYTPPEECP